MSPWITHDQAALATRENAEFNQVSDRVEVYSLTEFEHNQQRWDGHFDVVVANILAAPIIDLAPTFSQALARPGQLVLSGILDHQALPVLEGYPKINFAPMISEAEWVCLTGTVTRAADVRCCRIPSVGARIYYRFNPGGSIMAAPQYSVPIHTRYVAPYVIVPPYNPRKWQAYAA